MLSQPIVRRRLTRVLPALLLPGLALVPAIAHASTPAKPTSLAVHTSSHGTYLTWSGSASGWTVQQATNAAFTTGVHTYKLRGPGHQFTPWGLKTGTTFYFRVRSVSGSQHSSFTTPVHAAVRSRAQQIRVMTYNILRLQNDGTQEGGNTIAPWSKRKLKQVQLVTSADPDLLVVQEAGAWVGAPRGDRQVDDLAKALGGAYTVARTEIPADQPNFHRTGCYVLYKKSAYSAVGDGDYWDIGDGRFAAYQLLQNNVSGARVLMISTHFGVGIGRDADYMRKAEAETLLRKVANYRSNHDNVPVVFAGDFNSHGGRKHVIDGPTVAMRAAGDPDAFAWAQTRSNARYNSANQYQRRPPAEGRSIDHVYATRGVAIRSWRLIMKLVNGAYVGAIPSDHNPLVSDLTLPY